MLIVVDERAGLAFRPFDTFEAAMGYIIEMYSNGYEGILSII